VEAVDALMVEKSVAVVFLCIWFVLVTSRKLIAGSINAWERRLGFAPSAIPRRTVWLVRVVGICVFVLCLYSLLIVA